MYYGLHPNLKLACFVCYLKIINTFWENDKCILKQIVQGTQKWHWNLFVMQSCQLSLILQETSWKFTGHKKLAISLMGKLFI